MATSLSDDKDADTLKSHLLREPNPATGMNPKAILSGYYGPRGERLKYTVHEGALRLPQAALDLMSEHLHNFKSKYQLPAVDAVIRPSQSDRGMLVTELTVEVDATTNASITVARNRCFVEPALQQQQLILDEQRIRGGGEEDGIKHEPLDDAPKIISTDGDNVAMNIDDAPTAVAPIADSVVRKIDDAPAPVAPVDDSVAMQIDEAPAPVATVSDNTVIKVEPSSTNKPVPARLVSTVSSVATGVETVTVSTYSSTMPAFAPHHAVDTATTVQPTIVQIPTTITSSTTPTTDSSPPEITGTIMPLANKPAPQWEQNFIPGPNDEMQTEIKTPPPSWYNPTTISDLERSMLPEWFDSSATHRTPDTYLDTREHIRAMSTKVGNRFITQTLVRRTIAGDAGSLHRLHAFLTAWSLINEDAINDSTPTVPGMREEPVKSKRSFVWNDRWRDELTEAVVDEANSKRQKTIDWNAVADRVGNGAKAYDCEIEFLTLPLEARATAYQTERAITPDLTSSNGSKTATEMQAWLEHLVCNSKPNVVAAATTAAIKASPADLVDAQRGALTALVIKKATERACKEETYLIRALEEIQEQRLQKLENRFALMDDIECILEAERVALELERRDLYTARCRHWFGAGN